MNTSQFGKASWLLFCLLVLWSHGKLQCKMCICQTFLFLYGFRDQEECKLFSFSSHCLCISHNCLNLLNPSYIETVREGKCRSNVSKVRCLIIFYTFLFFFVEDLKCSSESWDSASVSGVWRGLNFWNEEYFNFFSRRERGADGVKIWCSKTLEGCFFFLGCGSSSVASLSSVVFTSVLVVVPLSVSDSVVLYFFFIPDFLVCSLSESSVLSCVSLAESVSSF